MHRLVFFSMKICHLLINLPAHLPCTFLAPIPYIRTIASANEPYSWLMIINLIRKSFVSQSTHYNSVTGGEFAPSHAGGLLKGCSLGLERLGLETFFTTSRSRLVS
jgi:hypothetical protein